MTTNTPNTQDALRVALESSREKLSTVNAIGYHLSSRLLTEASMLGIDAIDELLSSAKDVAQHSDDSAVDRFAIAMKAKMAESRAKGRSGWNDPAQCSTERLQTMLIDHLAKGDPVDVGNFAMMLFNRGSRTTLPSQQGAQQFETECDGQCFKCECGRMGAQPSSGSAPVAWMKTDADGENYFAKKIPKGPGYWRWEPLFAAPSPTVKEVPEDGREDAEFEAMRKERDELLAAMLRIKEEPNNTLSDGKAIREIMRIAKAAIAASKGGKEP